MLSNFPLNHQKIHTISISDTPSSTPNRAPYFPHLSFAVFIFSSVYIHFRYFGCTHYASSGTTCSNENFANAPKSCPWLFRRPLMYKLLHKSSRLTSVLFYRLKNRPPMGHQDRGTVLTPYGNDRIHDHRLSRYR